MVVRGQSPASAESGVKARTDSLVNLQRSEGFLFAVIYGSICTEQR